MSYTKAKQVYSLFQYIASGGGQDCVAPPADEYFDIRGPCEASSNTLSQCDIVELDQCINTCLPKRRGLGTLWCYTGKNLTK